MCACMLYADVRPAVPSLLYHYVCVCLLCCILLYSEWGECHSHVYVC